jgi:hypothetical protein
VTQATESGAVLMNETTGDCFELNHVAADIWKAVCAGKSADAIVTELATTYGIEESVAKGDVETLLTNLARHGLVCPVRP